MKQVFLLIILFFSGANFAFSQDRGSIPEALLRPGRSEAPHYPVDTVIGELGRGGASSSAFSFAESVSAGLISGRLDHPSLASLNQVYREFYLSALEEVNPQSYRIGGGRNEPDGAVSFLVRFLGRDMGITGELYIRFITQVNDEGISTSGNWVFEELLLEEARDLNAEQQSPLNRYDFYPYERFF